MKKEAKSTLTGWIKGAFSGGKKEMQESMQQKLSFILSTAPMWDRSVLFFTFVLFRKRLFFFSVVLL